MYIYTYIYTYIHTQKSGAVCIYIYSYALGSSALRARRGLRNNVMGKYYGIILRNYILRDNISWNNITQLYISLGIILRNNITEYLTD